MITEKISYIVLEKDNSDNILKNPVYFQTGKLYSRIVLFRIKSDEKYSLKFEIFNDKAKRTSSFSLEPVFDDDISSEYFNSDMGFNFSMDSFDIGDYLLKLSLIKIKNDSNQLLDSKSVIFNVAKKLGKSDE